MHVRLITPHPLSALDENLSRKLYWKKHPRRPLYESMSDWAEREVEIACKKADGYVAECCKSALKAFRSICADGHSGCSIGVTKSILNRLIDGKPLSPIEDVPELWHDCCMCDGEGKAVYQNARMSGLFKDVYPDGTVIFDDIDRTVLVEIDLDGRESTWHSGLASKLVDELVGHITLPYYPKDKPYKVYAQQFDSVNGEVGCFDTSHIIKVVDPDGNEIPCERFYAETADGEKEISAEEYRGRYLHYLSALKEHSK